MWIVRPRKAEMVPSTKELRAQREETSQCHSSRPQVSCCFYARFIEGVRVNIALHVKLVTDGEAAVNRRQSCPPVPAAKQINQSSASRTTKLGKGLRHSLMQLQSRATRLDLVHQPLSRRIVTLARERKVERHIIRRSHHEADIVEPRGTGRGGCTRCGARPTADECGNARGEGFLA